MKPNKILTILKTLINKAMNLVINTKTGNPQVSLGDNIYRDIEILTHPISGKKLYCFISSSYILPQTFHLHKLGSKVKRIANIFNNDEQQQILDFLTN